MEISTETEGQLTRVALDGEMTIYHAVQLKEELLKCVREHVDVELNLAKVSELDTAGFQLLVLCKRESRRLEHRFRLVEHSSPVLDIFSLYGCESYFGDPILISGAAAAA